jgi:hypothetical protein
VFLVEVWKCIGEGWLWRVDLHDCSKDLVMEVWYVEISFHLTCKDDFLLVGMLVASLHRFLVSHAYPLLSTAFHSNLSIVFWSSSLQLTKPHMFKSRVRLKKLVI